MAGLAFPEDFRAQRYDSTMQPALVIAASQNAGRRSADTLAACGCQVRATIDFAAAASDPGHFDGLGLLVIEAAAADDTMFDLLLARADMAARSSGVQVIAAIHAGQIDAAVAQLHAPCAQILCDPEDSERMTAISFAKWRGAELNDVASEAEAARLRRLNEEVARIADTLVKLTRSEASQAAAGVRAPDMPFRGLDACEETTASEVRAAIRSRRLREQFFAETLFGDPAWDMLLDLFAAALEQRQVSVSSLCIAAAVPPTTALRWIGTMHDAGLFERCADPSDRRRAYIALSQKGLDGMRNYASAAKRAGLAIA